MRTGLIRSLMAFAACAALCHGQGTISTVAGSSACCNSADGGQATSTWLPSTFGVVVDKQNNLYIWDSNSSKVRKVSPAGIIGTAAGNGSSGYTGDGGPATAARISGGNTIAGLALDDAGNLYISEGGNHVVRKVNAAGIISTVAGNGSPGFSGDGGLATSAQLNDPGGIVVDSAGNLYIADASNNRVRKVTAAGIITTIAGNGSVSYNGDSIPAISAVVDGPTGLALDDAGNLYISETSSARVRKVDTAGIITTVAGLTKKSPGFSGDGGPATAAMLYGPIGLAVDHSGNLYIADNVNGRIRKVDAAGIITTYAGTGGGTASTPIGDGGPATSAYIGVPKAIAFDAAGNLFIAGNAGGIARVRKVTPKAGLSANPGSLSFSYTIGGAAPGSQSVSVSSSGGAVNFSAAASTSSGGNWLSINPANASTTATLMVSVNAAGVPGGVYHGAITLTPTGGGTAPLSFAVTLTVAGAGAPVFTSSGVLNALGYQAKLAPDTVFVVFGSGMGPASLATASAPDYPTTLGGTSITFTPSSGGAAINARMVYTSAGQVAALLPSSAGPGTYAVRVTYNGLASAPQNVTVVARSFGIATANSAGTGTAQATIGNVNNGISLTRFTSGGIAFSGLNWTLSPAHPGDTLVLWGTGGGADTANDTGGTSGDQTAAGNFRVLVGSKTITPLYAGASSGYPGLWQVNFTLPGDAAPDCFASVQVSAGGELSNAVTVPIAAAGEDACSDPQLSKEVLGQLDKGGTIAGGGFGISKLTATSTFLVNGSSNTVTAAQEIASGGIAFYTAAEYAAINGGLKIGACTVTDRTAPANAKGPSNPEGYLDAGPNIPLNGPGVPASAVLAPLATTPGVYSLLFGTPTLVGGKYTLTAPGGKGVGAFNVSVTFPTSFTITNWDAIASIDRSKPLVINWTGSGLDRVEIIGSTSAVVGKDAASTNIIHLVTFTCDVPAAPGSYAVPVEVLSHLFPASIDAASAANGTAVLAVEAATTQPFTAPLTGGGQTAFGGLAAILGYSKNLAVQ
ncbi:MAG TPA: hypothetical protein VG675_05230 [Bryobacteraceae bacterium]|nr:hypothetical protein [Bryobacteraceae bacterium]